LTGGGGGGRRSRRRKCSYYISFQNLVSCVVVRYVPFALREECICDLYSYSIISGLNQGSYDGMDMQLIWERQEEYCWWENILAKWPFEILVQRWEDNIKMHLKDNVMYSG
jgi:hypothetical protein